MMTIEEAADLLHESLHEQPWFSMVGVGVQNEEPALYLYVKKKKGIKLPFVNGKWHGFPVVVQKLDLTTMNAR